MEEGAAEDAVRAEEAGTREGGSCGGGGRRSPEDVGARGARRAEEVGARRARRALGGGHARGEWEARARPTRGDAVREGSGGRWWRVGDGGRLGDLVRVLCFVFICISFC